jgi:hypothetical protein
MGESEVGAERRVFSRRWAGALTLAVTLAIGTRAAAASGSEEAEALIRQGVELRQQGKDERALPLFQKAYEILASPRSAGQLGLAEMAVGYWLDSEQHLSAALESPDHPWVAKNRAALEQSLAQVRSNIGEIAVEGTPAGAAVTANKRPAGTLPLTAPVRVPKGRVDIEVSAPGYVTTTRSLQIGGSERQQLTITLDKAPAESGGATTNEEPTGSATPAASAPQQPAPAATSADDGLTLRRQIGWGLGIAAGAALVGGVIETIFWQKDRGDFNNANMACDEGLMNRGAPGCSSLYDSLHRAETFAIVGYAAAVALGAGSAALFLTGRATETSGSRVACAPDLGSTFVRCRWSF